MDVSNTTRIVIVGKTGTGKSSLANTIFGEELFTIGHTLNSETRECRAETKSANGRSITLIDTPGFFDTDRSEEELKPEIVRCITECAPGPHVFLIVLKVEKFTKQEQAVITEINQSFSEEFFKYATVVFTHGDQLSKGQTIEDVVCNNTIMSDLMEKCGGRCQVVDNKYWAKNQQDEYRNNQFQVKELLKTIDTMIEANKGSCYTNEMLQAVEEEIQQEEELIRQSSGNMSEEEIREQAKGSIFDFDQTGRYYDRCIVGSPFWCSIDGWRSCQSFKESSVRARTSLKKYNSFFNNIRVNRRNSSRSTWNINRHNYRISCFCGSGTRRFNRIPCS